MCAEITGDRAKSRLTRGYVYLCHARADGNGAKTVSLARFGDYDVRLVEFVRARPSDPTPMGWSSTITKLNLGSTAAAVTTSKRPYMPPRTLFHAQGSWMRIAGNELRVAMLSTPSMAKSAPHQGAGTW
jgi:hypothetical protein